MNNKKVLFLTHAAMIAALYVVLTFISNAFGLASGAIQVRLSEALIILPVFTPAAIPGLYIGCLLSNLLCGGCLLDILLGSLATLIGALGARAMRKHKCIYCAFCTCCRLRNCWCMVVSDYHSRNRGNYFLWYIRYDTATCNKKESPLFETFFLKTVSNCPGVVKIVHLNICFYHFLYSLI